MGGGIADTIVGPGKKEWIGGWNGVEQRWEGITRGWNPHGETVHTM